MCQDLITVQGVEPQGFLYSLEWLECERVRECERVIERESERVGERECECERVTFEHRHENKSCSVCWEKEWVRE